MKAFDLLEFSKTLRSQMPQKQVEKYVQMSAANRCVSCHEIAPEGFQLCWKCAHIDDRRII